MSEKYQNKYRIASARAPWWDYGWNGAYFVTICTKNREHFFGEVRDGNMRLSRTGVIADIVWHQIPYHAPFVELGDFVVMPNHVHGIIILDKPDDTPKNNDDHAPDDRTDRIDRIVETLHATSLQSQSQSQPPKNRRMASISPRAQTLSTVVRSYKSAVTRHANRLGLEHGWQTRFHDRIIRDDAEYQRISDYIVANPENWSDDRFNDIP